MRVSLDEALGLFNKWKSESIPVLGVLRMASAALTFGGFINDVTPHGLVLSHYLQPEVKSMEFILGLDSVVGFGYQDLREAPVHVRQKFAGRIVAVLTVQAQSFDCCLYEMEKPSQAEPEA